MTLRSHAALKVYKAKRFARFADKALIGDFDLWKAADRANAGLIDADLGGGVIKQRIARVGQGKSGGSRSIIVFRRDDRAVFIHGFEKKDVANLTVNELVGFRRLAHEILRYSDSEMAQRVADGSLLEVNRPEEKEDA